MASVENNASLSGDRAVHLGPAVTIKIEQSIFVLVAPVEEGVEGLADSSIIAPSGEILAKTQTSDDELVTAVCDLDWCYQYKDTLFNFDRYRRPEVYGPITGQRGVVLD